MGVLTLKNRVSIIRASRHIIIIIIIIISIIIINIIIITTVIKNVI